MAKVDKGAWTSGKLRLDKHMTLEEVRQELKNKQGGGSVGHADKWHNRRPICPYGCGEEGTLLEVITKFDGVAVGVYTHSDSVKPFTADLVMKPNPKERKLVLGMDGQYSEVEA